MHDWLKTKLAKLGESAVLLLQGYPYTGFAQIDHLGIHLPPKAGEVLLDRNLYWDIRMFSEQGEVHLWRKNAKGDWDDRFLAANQPAAIDRQCVLWGEAKAEGEWTCCLESRGVKFWLPATSGKTLALGMKLIVEEDKETGLVGIRDAMICGIQEAQK